jgi:PAP2 superfamily protein
MRTVEWLNLIVFSVFFIAAWLRPITSRSRRQISLMAATGITLVIAVQFANRVLPFNTVSVFRDWLPAPLMLMAYWQAGRFSRRPNERFQNYLHKLDRKWVETMLCRMADNRIYRSVSVCLELAYLSCYALVPFGLVALYLAHMRSHANEYWLVILLATYPCYLFTAFVPTLPPRKVRTDSVPTRPGKIRAFNLWIIRQASIGLNTFPSAHVTATLGASLILLRYLPNVGLIFLLVSIGIAAGAVTGRYHYAADVIVAATLVIVIFSLNVFFF